jgi:hypothetical protein
MYYGDVQDGVYVSSNTGVTWRQTSVPFDTVNAPGYYVACSSNGATVLVASPTKGVYVSTDTGATWTTVTALSPYVATLNYSVSVSPDGATMAIGVNQVAGSNITAYVSLDGGVSWGLTVIPNSVSGGWLLMLACMNQSNLFSILGNSPFTVYRLNATSSAVSTPVAIPTNYQYTTNAGSTFTSSSPPDTVSPSLIPNLTNGSAVTVQLRGYTSGGVSAISNGLSITPGQPAVPAAWLLFDPNNATSYSGSGTVNNIGTFGRLGGSINGSVTHILGTGIAGKVFNLNGGYIAFPTFTFGSAFTISAWINPTAKFSINGILTNGFANANTAGFKFAYNSWQTTNYNLIFEDGDGTTGNWYIPSSVNNTVTPGVWQMVTVIFNRTARTAIFLLNGLPVAVYGIATASNVTVTGAFNIGAYMGGSYTMKAQLGLLKVYNSTLTASQVYDSFIADASAFGLSGLPDAPSLTATPADSSVSIAFTQGSTGGTPISNYSYSTDGITFTPFSPPQTTSPLTITGLTNGTSYTISIKAINAFGSGAPASVSVTLPVVIPTAPSISATPTDSSASIAFIQGSNGGSPITNYSYSTNGITFTPLCPPQTGSPLTISGLTNGTPYTIYIKAITAAGSSAASAPVTVIPANIIDVIVNTLTTSLAVYIDSNEDDWISITSTEYNDLSTNMSGTTKVGIADSYLSTANGSGLTNANSALVANSATTKSPAIPVNNYLYAFAVKWVTTEPTVGMAVYTNTNSASADGFNQVGSLLPTISSGISYFVRRSPSTANGPSGLLACFSGTKMDYSNPSFTGSGGYIGVNVLQGTGLTPIPAMRYLLGDGTPPAANSTLSGNLGAYGAFCIQGLTTPTLQWN